MGSGWTRVSLLWTNPSLNSVIGEPTFMVPRSQFGKVVTLPEKWAEPSRAEDLLLEFYKKDPRTDIMAVAHDDEHTQVLTVYSLHRGLIVEIEEGEFRAFSGFNPADYMGFTKLHDERG